MKNMEEGSSSIICGSAGRKRANAGTCVSCSRDEGEGRKVSIVSKGKYGTDLSGGREP